MSLSLLIEKFAVHKIMDSYSFKPNGVNRKLITEFVEFVGRNRIDVIKLKSVFSHQHTPIIPLDDFIFPF